MPRPHLAALCAFVVMFVLGTALMAAPPETASSIDYWATRGCPAGDPRCQWFRDAKFGAIIHFGVYSELGGYYEGKGPYRPAEQIMGLGERRATIPPDVYRANVASKFNPQAFDADVWVKQLKAAGQKYVIITTKHHDGFCMFDTATTDFDVVDSTPFGRDIVKEIAAACRANDMRFCIYYSIGDWSAKDVMDKRFANYGEYMKAQLAELLTNYGKVDLVWFDNYWYVDDQWSNDTQHARELYNFVRQLQPETLVNDRCGAGVAEEHGDFATPENQLKGSLQTRYFEVVMTCTDDDNWGWVRDAQNYRKPEQIVRNIVDSASKGGNFVFNIGPDGTGAFPQPQQTVLKAIGDWTSHNATALYGTVPAPEVVVPAGAGCFATKSADGKHIYLQVAKWPAQGPLQVSIENAGVDAYQVKMLDERLSLPKIEQATSGEQTVLSIDRPAAIDNAVTVIVLSPM